MRSDIDILALMDTALPNLCAVCGKPLPWFPEKGYYGDHAHILNNTNPHRKYYGDALIESKYNGLKVCSDNNNKCNNAIGINRGSQPVLADQVAAKILALMLTCGR